MEEITNSDYNRAKRVCKNFEVKNLGEYYDLYLKSTILLLGNVFETLEKCVQLDLAKFPPAPRLVWQAALKITKAELELLTDISMLLMVRIWYVINGLRMELEEEHVTLLIDMQKLIINIWKIMIKIRNHYILSIGM